MSNKLAKILIICSLVMVLPLFIAGSVVAVYHAMDAEVTFEVAYTSTFDTNDRMELGTLTTDTARATLTLDEENGGYVLSNAQFTKTGVTANATGFDLVGWYNGTKEEYALAVSAGEVEYLSTDETLYIETADYTNITAVFAVKSYNITYTDNGTATLIYGEGLKTLADTTSGAFAGWTVSGSEDTTVYTYATFADSTVILVASYGSYTNVAHTATLATGDYTYSGNTSVTFTLNSANTDTYYETVLADMFTASNYTHATYPNSWSVTSWTIKVDDEHSYTYTTEITTEMYNAVYGTAKAITITPNFTCNYSSITIETIAYNVVGNELGNVNIYTSNSSSEQDYLQYSTASPADLANITDVFTQIGYNSTLTYYESYTDKTSNTDALTLYSVNVACGGVSTTINADSNGELATYTGYAFIEYLATNISGFNGTISITFTFD